MRDKLNKKKLKQHIEHFHDSDEAFGHALAEAATEAAFHAIKNGKGKECISVTDLKLEVMGVDDDDPGSELVSRHRRCYWVCYTIGGRRICRRICTW